MPVRRSSTPPGLIPMKFPLWILAPLVLAAVPALTPSFDVVGKSLPPAPIADLAQTKAKSLDDYAGRALLVEFFAYW